MELIERPRGRGSGHVDALGRESSFVAPAEDVVFLGAVKHVALAVGANGGQCAELTVREAEDHDRSGAVGNQDEPLFFEDVEGRSGDGDFLRLGHLEPGQIAECGFPGDGSDGDRPGGDETVEKVASCEDRFIEFHWPTSQRVPKRSRPRPPAERSKGGRCVCARGT